MQKRRSAALDEGERLRTLSLSRDKSKKKSSFSDRCAWCSRARYLLRCKPRFRLFLAATFFAAAIAIRDKCAVESEKTRGRKKEEAEGYNDARASHGRKGACATTAATSARVTSEISNSPLASSRSLRGGKESETHSSWRGVPWGDGYQNCACHYNFKAGFPRPPHSRHPTRAHTRERERREGACTLAERSERKQRRGSATRVGHLFPSQPPFRAGRARGIIYREDSRESTQQRSREREKNSGEGERA